MDTDTTETWIYAGAKVIDGRLRHRWVPDPERLDYLLIYPTGAAVIGGLYQVQVRREGTEHTYMVGKPFYKGERMDDHQRMTQYITMDMSEKQKHAALRREKKDGGKDPLDEAMRPLIAYAREAGKTTHGKDALAATVLRRLYDAW